jgi:chemotaxis protein CheD
LRHIVGVAEMKISSEPEDVIVTYALGSCLGITLYDPVARVGGLLHVMLPLSTLDPQRAADTPCMFVDTGVPRLFLEAYKEGVKKSRAEVRVAGGARMDQGQGDRDLFQIGKRNIVVFRKLLWKNDVRIKAEDVGGSESRTVSLDMADGTVTITVNMQARVL